MSCAISFHDNARFRPLIIAQQKIKMTESKEDQEKRHLRELEGKNIEHYSVLLQAWIQTKMERDKTLVTLSAAGTGLLVTILTTAGVRRIWEVLLYLGSFAGFLTTIWTSLTIYQLNSKHVETELKQSKWPDLKLEKYDKRSTRAFILGAICACLIGVVAATNQVSSKMGVNMTKKKETASQVIRDKKSLDGLSGLRPESTQSENSNSQTQQSSNSSNSDTSSGSNASNDSKK